MKILFTILLLIIAQHVFAQSLSPKDTVISKQQFLRNQDLQNLLCNILQYIAVDGKITNKKAFSSAVQLYLEYLKHNPQESLIPQHVDQKIRGPTP